MTRGEESITRNHQRDGRGRGGAGAGSARVCHRDGERDEKVLWAIVGRRGKMWISARVLRQTEILAFGLRARQRGPTLLRARSQGGASSRRGVCDGTGAHLGCVHVGWLGASAEGFWGQTGGQRGRSGRTRTGERRGWDETRESTRPEEGTGKGRFMTARKGRGRLVL